jgi:predicted O-linked N-acetylglucosamine transferase (SPINDLY family)
MDQATDLGAALALHQAGHLAEARKAYEQVIAADPNHIDALHYLAILTYQDGNAAEATRIVDRALARAPAFAPAHSNRGTFLLAQHRHQEALASFDAAITLNPTDAQAHNNRGVALHGLKRFEDALAGFDRAIAINPNYAKAYSDRAYVLTDLKALAQAVASCDRAIALQPDLPAAHQNRAVALHHMRRYGEAVQSFDHVLALNPEFAEAHENRGVTLFEMQRHDEALASLDRAVALNPQSAGAYHNRGNVLEALKRYPEAIASHERAAALDPQRDYALGSAVSLRQRICAWDNLAERFAELAARVEAGQLPIAPFAAFATPLTLRHLQQAATRHFQLKTGLPAATPIAKRTGRDKIRIGYFSADFHTHAVSSLCAGLFERHDRSQFETYGFLLADRPMDAMRQRVEHAFTRFFDVSTQSDVDVAALARAMEIDIAVDLMGYTRDGRPEIFARRAAPIQVNYLGFPGTMGAPCMDYLITDRMTVPPEHRPYYTEKIVHLPNAYLPTDSRREISARNFTRAALGLPDTGFIFCCFNNTYKITPDVFDTWMRLLARVDNSVLWLARANEDAVRNLKLQAVERGISSERLVFAENLPSNADHLARYRVAGLFLDTFLFSAHATAIDALWAGLPVLSYLGETSARRGSASILAAAGLSQLITHTVADYERLALELATNPAKLAGISQQLQQNRLTCPLFDTQRFTRNLEKAYRGMWQLYQFDRAPTDFAVADETESQNHEPG